MKLKIFFNHIISEILKNPNKRLTCFFIGLLISISALEVLVQNNEPLFKGASHKMMAKAAVFNKKKSVDLVFFGTSITQDGVSPPLVSRRLKEIVSSNEINIYNAASTGSSIEDLIVVEPMYSHKLSLHAVIIELSDPLLNNKPTIPLTYLKSENKNIEKTLAESLNNLDFIKYRKAFYSDNIGRLLSLLLFSSLYSGHETRLIDQFNVWFNITEPSPLNYDETIWTPEIISTNNPVVTLNQKNEELANKMTSFVKLYTEKGIKVIFIVPPVSASPSTKQDQYIPLYEELARRTKCNIWNFNKHSIPDYFFKDPTHLNRKKGRAHWSYALADQINNQILRSQ